MRSNLTLEHENITKTNLISAYDESDLGLEMQTSASYSQITSLRTLVFTDICIAKNKNAMPVTLFEVEALFNISNDYFHFLKLLKLSPEILNFIFSKHQVCMVMLKLNERPESTLAKIVDFRSFHALDFAAAKGLSLIELNAYLREVFNASYWEIKLFNSTVKHYLEELRQASFNLKWDWILARFFGCMADDLHQVQRRIFSFPLAHTVRALKQMSDKDFSELVADFDFPIAQLTAVGKDFIRAQLIKNYSIHFKESNTFAPLTANLFTLKRPATPPGCSSKKKMRSVK